MVVQVVVQRMAVAVYLFAMALEGFQAAAVASNGQLTSIGISAYEQGDFKTALSALKTAVYNSTIQEEAFASIDIRAAAYLSRMLVAGEGGPPDRPLACALYAVAIRQSEARGPNTQGAAMINGIIKSDPCERSSPDTEREVRALMNGCFLPGISGSTFTLDNGWISIDRTGIHLQLGDISREEGLPDVGSCGFATLPVAFSEVRFQDGNGDQAVRYFLHFFTWKSEKKRDTIARELRWYLIELGAAGIKVPVMRTLADIVDKTFPSLELPVELENSVVLEPASDSRVHWVLKPWHAEGYVK